MGSFRPYDDTDDRYLRYVKLQQETSLARAIMKKKVRDKLRMIKLRERKRKRIKRLGTPRASLADSFNMIALHYGLPYRFADNPLNPFYPYFKLDYSNTRQRPLRELSMMYKIADSAVAARIRSWKGLFSSFTKQSHGWEAVKYSRIESKRHYGGKVPPHYKRTVLDKYRTGVQTNKINN